MSTSKLDAVYRSILLTKFFTKGWGKPENLRRLFEFRKIVSNREECYKLISPNYPITITKEEKHADCHILEGHFLSPLETFLPGVVPHSAQQAHFQVIMPSKWPESDYKPMCVHLAGTGDHYFWRRRNLMAKPLLKDAAIGSIILENPFYGMRKPEDQVRSSLHNVSDIFVMGGCLILETLVLLHWCESNGLGPLGVTGLSMGGHMASLAATNWPKPLVLVPCLSWSTASAVFTQGVMASSINWDLLETQFSSDGEYKNHLAKMVTVIDEAFLAGRRFAQHFSRKPVNNVMIDMSSFEIPMISNNGDHRSKKFDITNPNNVSSCPSFCPEVIQSYNIIRNKERNSNISENNFVSLEVLNQDQKISDNLFKKINSKEKFQLEPSEISELNELSFFTHTNVNSNHGKSIQSNVHQNFDSESKLNKSNDSECSNTTEDLVVVNSESIELNNKTKQNTTENNGKNIEKTTNILTKTILSGIPFLVKQKQDTPLKCKNREALQFMRGVMDEFTHLGNFSIPYDTSLIIAVCAKHDAYVPRSNFGTLEELWPGAEIRYIDAGHVSAYVLHQSLFRSCIIEAFKKSKKKWLEKNMKASVED